MKKFSNKTSAIHHQRDSTTGSRSETSVCKAKHCCTSLRPGEKSAGSSLKPLQITHPYTPPRFTNSSPAVSCYYRRAWWPRSFLKKKNRRGEPVCVCFNHLAWLKRQARAASFHKKLFYFFTTFFFFLHNFVTRNTYVSPEFILFHRV